MAEYQRGTDVFKLGCWRRLSRVSWTARSNQSILKEINAEYSSQGLMLKLKLQYFGHLVQIAEALEKTLRAGGEGATEDEMGGWHHRFNRHEVEQTPGDGDGQGSLACCSPGGSQRVRHD